MNEPIQIDKDLQIAALERKLADATIEAVRWESAAMDFRQQLLQATVSDEIVQPDRQLLDQPEELVVGAEEDDGS